MKKIFARTILILSVILILTGTTVALAGGSIPGTPFYAAKLAMERIKLNRTSDPAQIASQHLVMAQRRTQELARLARAGEIPGEDVGLRIEEHLNASLQVCMQLGERDRQGILMQAQRMIQAQIQELNQVRTRSTVLTQDSLDQTIALMEAARVQVNALAMGEDNPDRQNQPGPGGLGGNPGCPSSDCEPVGDQHQYGPQPEQPGPGEPGGNPDCPSDDCEPIGDQHQYGPQPEQPGPGEPGGNPDCPSGDCEPVGDQQQCGPQPEQPGPGGAGGNPDCPSEGCEPVGDQHQHHNSSQPPGSGGSGGGHNRP